MANGDCLITGFRLGKMECRIAKPAKLGDILRANGIDPGNGTFTVDGRTYAGGASAENAPVNPSTSRIEVSAAAKGGA